MKKLFFILVILKLTACVEILDIEKPKVKSVKTTSIIEIQVTDGASLNTFNAHLQIPAGHFVLKRTLLSQKEMPLVESAVSGPEWIDPNQMEGGEIYLYDFGHYEQSQILSEKKWVSEFSTQFQAPFDLILNEGNPTFVVDSDQKASKLMKIRKLIMKRNTFIYTMGRDLQIHAEYIMSDEGRLFSFPDEATAAAGNNGRAGGKVVLAIEAAAENSVLLVNIHGESGGVGENASPLSNGGCSKGNRGGSGFNGGDAGTFKYKIPAGLFVDARVESGRAGSGGNGGRGSECLQCENYEEEMKINSLIPLSPIKCSRIGFGPTGDRGPNGVDGKTGSLCRIQEDKQICQ